MPDKLTTIGKLDDSDDGLGDDDPDGDHEDDDNGDDASGGQLVVYQARWSWLGLELLDLAGTNSTGCPASKSKHFQPDLGENTAQC